MSNILRCLFWSAVFACVSGALCFATNITIRILDITTGQAVPDLPVWVYLADERPFGPPLTVKTANDGQAVFQLPSPLPTRILLMAEVSGKIGQCSSSAFDSREVIEHGVLGDTKYRKCSQIEPAKGNLTVKPGEIIVFVRPLHWWERMQK